MKHLLVWQHHLLQLFDRENQVHQLLLLTNVEVLQLRWPGRLADLQGKFFDQLKQLQMLFERGTLTKEQFEKRKQVVLDCLDELASK